MPYPESRSSTDASTGKAKGVAEPLSPDRRLNAVEDGGPAPGNPKNGEGASGWAR